MSERERLAALQAENARLTALLDAHGIPWRPSASTPMGVRETESTTLTTEQKVALFRKLFRGRVDVYPVRWESKSSGKAGYAPACGNEWRPGVCEKPRIKCGDCAHRLLLPVSDDVIFGHLAGKHTIGQQPIIFMQCGPIRYKADPSVDAPHDLAVIPHFRAARIDVPTDAGIQDVFRQLVSDASRTAAIAREVAAAYQLGRKVLVLTERTEHVTAIASALGHLIPQPFVLHGRLSKRQRAAVIESLAALPEGAPRVLVATGKLIGEGFDHPALDTMVLAMPVSWRGTLQQYAGRLHRQHAAKSDVRIIDFVDAGQPALLRMWDKRQRGYRAMGYRVAAPDKLVDGEHTQALELGGIG